MSGLLGKTSLNLMMKEGEKRQEKEIFKMWLPTVYLEDPSYFPEEKRKKRKKKKK